MKMKETMKRRQHTEKKGTLGKVLTATALLGMLSLSPSEGLAQNGGGTQGGATVTEVTTPGKEIDTEKTKDWESALQEMKDSKTDEITDIISQPDTEGGSDGDTPEGDDTDGEPEGDDVHEIETTPDAEAVPDTPEKDESKIRMGGIIQVGSGVAADAAEVCSDKPEVTMVFDISHKDSGLGLSLVRLEDFGLDKVSPVSQATIIDPYLSKQLGPGGKIKLTFEGKYTIIDKKPELSGFAPDVKLAYSDKGWTIECMYIHKFQKGEDSDAFRLTVSKMMSKAFELTLQGRYETGYAKHFYGRLISRVYLGSGIAIEVSCIVKHDKLTPTGGIIWRF